MQSNDVKVTSFRVSQGVKDDIQRLAEKRQLTTNQLFEELITLADKQSPDPLILEENSTLEAALNQILVLFNERAMRLNLQQTEYERVTSRYKKTVQDLEHNVMLETEYQREEFERELEKHKTEFEQLQQQMNQLSLDQQAAYSQLETERTSFKEDIKSHKRVIFNLEGDLKKLEDERGQLYRQNQNLIDMIDELKARTRRIDQLEEENQALHLEVQLLRREKEAFDHRLQEQVELAVLRERNKINQQG